MSRSASRSFAAYRIAAPAAAGLLLLASAVLPGCLGGGDPTGPLPAPVAVAGITITDPSLVSSTPDPLSDATCQTTAAVRLEANGSHDPARQPLTFEWRDEVDYGDGTGRHPSADWGFESNVLRTQEFELPTRLFTTAVHYITLTVRTRDGRSASETLRVTVTSCEQCGTP